jgi:hypothetical protein
LARSVEVLKFSRKFVLKVFVNLVFFRLQIFAKKKNKSAKIFANMRVRHTTMCVKNFKLFDLMHRGLLPLNTVAKSRSPFDGLLRIHAWSLSVFVSTLDTPGPVSASTASFLPVRSART